MPSSTLSAESPNTVQANAAWTDRSTVSVAPAPTPARSHVTGPSASGAVHPTGSAPASRRSEDSGTVTMVSSDATAPVLATETRNTKSSPRPMVASGAPAALRAATATDSDGWPRICTGRPGCDRAGQAGGVGALDLEGVVADRQVGVGHRSGADLPYGPPSMRQRASTGLVGIEGERWRRPRSPRPTAHR